MAGQRGSRAGDAATAATPAAARQPATVTGLLPVTADDVIVLTYADDGVLTGASESLLDLLDVDPVAVVGTRYRLPVGGDPRLLVSGHPLPARPGEPAGQVVVAVRDPLLSPADSAMSLLLAATQEADLDPLVVLAAVRDDSGTIVDFVYTEANDVACRYNRMARGDLVGARLLDLLPGHSRELLAAYVSAVESGETLTLRDVVYEQELIGEARRYDVRAIPIGDSLVYTWRDVTDVFTTAARLADAESRYRLVAENVTDVVFLSTASLVWQWVSPSSRATLGWAPEELVGRSAPEFVHPADIAALRNALAENPLAPLTMRIRFRRPDGQYRWVSAAGRGFLDEATGFRGRVVAMRDVDAEVAAEQATAASDARYRLLVENSADVIFQSVDGVLTWMSPSVTSMLGFTPEELVGQRSEHLWVGDGAAVTRDLQRRPRLGQTAGGTYPVRTKDGQVRWLEVTARPYVTDDGRPGSTGVARDVTDRVEATDALLVAEERFRLIAENSLDVVLLSNMSGVITWASPSTAHALDWSALDLAGTYLADLLHPADPAPGDSGDGAAVVFEQRFRTGSGSWRWMRVTRRVQRDTTGDPVGLVDTLRDVQAEIDVRDRLAFEASHDSRTRLRNRRWTLDALADALADGTPVGLLVVAVDDLDAITAAFTHTAADRVLAAVAERLVDVVDRDSIARTGDNQLAVIAVGDVSTVRLDALAGRLHAAAAATVAMGAQDIAVSVSIGVAVSRDGQEPGELLRDASTALRSAQAAGGNRWDFADPASSTTARTRLALRSGLRHALTTGAIRAWYQPVVSLADGAVSGHEALVRWVRSDGDVLLPGEFLPVAEHSGLVAALDRAVLDDAVTTLAGLPAAQHMAVNMSAASLAADDLAERVLAAVDGAGVDRTRLHLEVTETSLVHVSDAMLGQMSLLRDAGVTWWVDDFGTGYSSISHLRDMPVGGLKLDRAFVHGISSHEPTRRLAQGLLGLASGLGLSTVAEGVSSRADAKVVSRQGWQFAQGWLFGRPQPVPLVDLPAPVDVAAARQDRPVGRRRGTTGRSGRSGRTARS